MHLAIAPHSIKNELKGMAALGSPLVLSQIMSACPTLFGTAMVAHLGQEALAANALVYSIYMALSIFNFAINAISVPLEILLMYGFIFGKFGLPACGIAGVGYGLAVSWTMVVIGMMIYLTTARRYKALHLFAKVGTINLSYCKELIKVGLPMGFMGFVEVSTFAVIALWMAKFGATALAAYQIFMQYAYFFIVFVFAIAQTIAIRVGHSAGRQDIAGIHYAAYIGLGISIFCSLTLASLFYFFSQTFLSLDINVGDPAMENLVRTAKRFLTIFSVFFLVESFRFAIGYGVLRGLKDVRFTMLVSILSFWVMGLILAFLFSFVFHFQEIGLWYGLTLGIALGTVTIIVRWHNLMERIDLSKLILPEKSI